MWQRIRKWLGLCEYKRDHATNIINSDGPYEILICKKCGHWKLRRWY
jgi:hypothetical protein